MTWDEYFISMTMLVAMKSKDPSTRIGAIIVGNNNEVLSTGYNGLPRNLDDSCSERDKRPNKYFWYEHAERNSIYAAALIGVSTKNTRMYTHGLPCADCARACIQAGIKKIITIKTWDEQLTDNFKSWDESRKQSKIMLQEAGIEWEKYDGNVLTQLHILKSSQKLVLPNESEYGMI